MKHFLKVFLLLLLCVTMFTACELIGKKPAEETTTGDDSTITNPPAEDLLVIVKNDGKSDYRLIMGDNVSFDILSTFVNDVQKNTGMSAAKQKFSQYKHATRPKDDFEITFNARNGREDAATAFETANPSEWSIQVSGNRVIVVSYSEAGLKAAMKDLKAAFKKDADGNWGIPKNYSATGKGLEKSRLQWTMMSEKQQADYTAVLEAFDALPFFDSNVGVFHPVYDAGDEGFSMAIENATKAEYDAYLAELKEMGYQQYSVNTLPAAKDGKYNVYHTLTSEKVYIFMQWQDALNMVRISVQPAQPLPSLEKVECTAADNVPVTVAQTQLAVASFGGMGYVYQLADGKLIVVDGGSSAPLTNDILMQYLKDRAAFAGMDKPVIAMWIYSHPHGDHIGVVSSDFLERCKNEGIVIESFGYNFAGNLNCKLDGNHTSAVQVLEELMAIHYPNATIYKMHAGQVYYFKGMEIEILATQEEVYPLLTANEQNDHCVTWRLKFDNEKTAMFLADNSVQVNRQLVKVYGNYLKSDILQVAHHGLSGGELNCYKAIDPDICLWSSPYLRFMNFQPGTFLGGFDRDQWGLGFRYETNSEGEVVDMNGEATDDPAKAKKVVISSCNLWLLDESIKKRYDYHNNETTIVGTDMSVTIERTEDSSLIVDLPTFEPGQGNATGFDYKSLDSIPGGKETIYNWSSYFPE